MGRTIIEQTILVDSVTNQYYPELQDQPKGIEFFEEIKGFVDSRLYENGSDKSNFIDTDSRICRSKIDIYLTQEIYFEINGHRTVVEEEARIKHEITHATGFRYNPKHWNNVVAGIFGRSGFPCTDDDTNEHRSKAAEAVAAVKKLLDEMNQLGFQVYATSDVVHVYADYLRRKAIIKAHSPEGPYQDENGVWHIAH